MFGRISAGRRRGPLSSRINTIAPQYTKRLAIMALVGCIGVYCFASLQEPELKYPGRELTETRICNGDTILPLIPFENTWDLPTRGVLYLLFLAWLFLGVAISADCFMAAIEIITATTTTVSVDGKDVEIDVWNSTVANLTLMALGSSAPEILLAVVETVSLKFQAGDLGPGTIVGSAAFNLLFITAICISCLPENEENPDELDSRKIEEFGVFVITAIASLFAYFWMVIALAWSSKDEIMIWEALVTLLMFPALVWVSWAEDQSWWGWFDGSDKVHPDGEEESGPSGHVAAIDGHKVRRGSQAGSVQDAMDKEDGEIDPQAAAVEAAKQEFKKKKKSRLQYRIQATRQMTGGKRVLPSDKGKAEEVETKDVGPPTTIDVAFQKSKMEVDESCGNCEIKVVRSGIIDKPCTVQFDTSDGDAIAGDDYVSASGPIEFEAGQTEKMISVAVIDDNEWAPDKHFYVRLFSATASGEEPKVRLTASQLDVTILNDDDPGTITFKGPTTLAIKNKETVQIPVIRKDGYDGNVLVFAKTVNGDGIAGVDYEALPEEYELHFEHSVREQFIEINLITNPAKESCNFSVEITAVEPEGAKIDDKCGSTMVVITNDPEYEKVMKEVTELMHTEMDKYGVGTSSWSEQLHNAMNMEGDGDEFEWSDYLLHFLSFYWKVLHAMVPPTDYGGGWPTFWIALIFTGVITCFVGDCAKMLGCVIGLKDSVTAITFVALGTSLPDTFASMQATIEDDTADAAITNVTGSNSVNVFLGLGLPWCMAVIYHASNGTKYVYPAGDLVFSVLVFFIFAVGCIILLVVRRNFCGGELGGNKVQAYASSAVLGVAWFVYILISAMKSYGHI